MDCPQIGHDLKLSLFNYHKAILTSSETYFGTALSIFSYKAVFSSQLWFQTGDINLSKNYGHDLSHFYEVY